MDVRGLISCLTLSLTAAILQQKGADMTKNFSVKPDWNKQPALATSDVLVKIINRFAEALLLFMPHLQSVWQVICRREHSLVIFLQREF